MAKSDYTKIEADWYFHSWSDKKAPSILIEFPDMKVIRWDADSGFSEFSNTFSFFYPHLGWQDFHDPPELLQLYVYAMYACT